MVRLAAYDLLTLKESEVKQDSLLGFYKARHEQWKVSLRSLATALENKGTHLRRAQVAVGFSALLMLIVFVVAASQ